MCVVNVTEVKKSDGMKFPWSFQSNWIVDTDEGQALPKTPKAPSKMTKKASRGRASPPPGYQVGNFIEFSNVQRNHNQLLPLKKYGNQQRELGHSQVHKSMEWWITQKSIEFSKSTRWDGHVHTIGASASSSITKTFSASEWRRSCKESKLTEKWAIASNEKRVNKKSHFLFCISFELLYKFVIKNSASIYLFLIYK